MQNKLSFKLLLNYLKYLLQGKQVEIGPPMLTNRTFIYTWFTWWTVQTIRLDFQILPNTHFTYLHLYLRKINIFGNYLFTYQGQYILKILRVKKFNCPSRCASHAPACFHSILVPVLLSIRKKKDSSTACQLAGGLLDAEGQEDKHYNCMMIVRAVDIVKLTWDICGLHCVNRELPVRASLQLFQDLPHQVL